MILNPGAKNILGCGCHDGLAASSILFMIAGLHRFQVIAGARSRIGCRAGFKPSHFYEDMPFFFLQYRH